MEKSELEKEICEICDFNQEKIEEMGSKNRNSKKRIRSMEISKAFHHWTFSEYSEAKKSGAINAKSFRSVYKLKYTLSELEEFIMETVERGDRFAGEEHFRLFIFLRLAMKLPKSVYSSIFWFFHDQQSEIIPYIHTNGLAEMPYFQAKIKIDRLLYCPLHKDVIDQVGDVKLELRYGPN